MVLASIRQHYNAVYSAILANAPKQTNTPQIQAGTASPSVNSTSPVQSSGNHDFKGNVSFRDLLKTGGDTALMNYLQEQITESGTDLKKHAGETIVIPNRSLGADDGAKIKAKCKRL